MYYSYVMGIGDEIYILEEKGFAIERFVCFDSTVFFASPILGLLSYGAGAFR